MGLSRGLGRRVAELATAPPRLAERVVDGVGQGVDPGRLAAADDHGTCRRARRGPSPPPSPTSVGHVPAVRALAGSAAAVRASPACADAVPRHRDEDRRSATPAAGAVVRHRAGHGVRASPRRTAGSSSARRSAAGEPPAVRHAVRRRCRGSRSPVPGCGRPCRGRSGRQRLARTPAPRPSSASVVVDRLVGVPRSFGYFALICSRTSRHGRGGALSRRGRRSPSPLSFSKRSASARAKRSNSSHVRAPGPAPSRRGTCPTSRGRGCTGRGRWPGRGRRCAAAARVSRGCPRPSSAGPRGSRPAPGSRPAGPRQAGGVERRLAGNDVPDLLVRRRPRRAGFRGPAGGTRPRRPPAAAERARNARRFRGRRSGRRRASSASPRPRDVQRSRGTPAEDRQG